MMEKIIEKKRWEAFYMGGQYGSPYDYGIRYHRPAVVALGVEELNLTIRLYAKGTKAEKLAKMLNDTHALFIRDRGLTITDPTPI
jgi:hypothetical protein